MFFKSSKFKPFLVIVLVIGAIAFSIGLDDYLRPTSSIATYASTPTTRDKWLWPFAQDSIWNLPIGSDAQYSPANLPKAIYSSLDTDLLYVIPANSPSRKLYNPGSWTNRCSGTTTYEYLSIPIPDDLIVPDAIVTPTKYFTPNNAAALLQPDGKTLIQLEPMARCIQGGPVYGYHWPRKDIDIYGKGTFGAHMGSGLSSIGGTIRKGELTNSEPIRHTLKLELWEKYLKYDAASPTPGYRWPADRADNAAPSMYKGTNPQLVMGSLLAIPPNVTEDSLGLTTPVSKKLFHALQDYGGYVVDTTGGDAYAIAIEQGVEQEFKTAYGYSIYADVRNITPFYEDFMKLFKALNVITNNSAETVGGGGTRRAPLAPPISN